MYTWVLALVPPKGSDLELESDPVDASLVKHMQTVGLCI